MICPAKAYTPADDICVITSYFNPCKYHSLLANYLMFRDSMEASGVTLVTVECAFGSAPFQLDPGDNVIQVRSDSVLWQKERLLNIAIEKMRTKYPKIAWIDADLFFCSDDWLIDASKLLDQFGVVQLFERIVQLPRGATSYDGASEGDRGFASVVCRDLARLKQPYDRHGRTGGAWCARSSVLAHGIFDACVLGDSDHVMAHALYGDWTSACIDQTFYHDRASLDYFELWAKRFAQTFEGGVSFLPQTVLHLWHGKPQNRLYKERTEKLARFGVDPLVDLRLNSDLCWEWNTKRPALHDYVAKYFELRNDDDCHSPIKVQTT